MKNAEDAADLAVYDARKAEQAGDDVLPAPVSAAILRGSRLLEALRDWRGMTQSRLAEATGLAQGHLSDLERGRRQGTPETLARIAEALDIPPTWLVG